ncbi:MAG: DEAD/DEAH box helicase family protein [Luteolibacter sp.]
MNFPSPPASTSCLPLLYLPETSINLAKTMPFDFNSLKPQAANAGPIDPIQIFRGLRVRDTAVNDLWLGQAEALQPWHEHRAMKDVAVGLNTGAGKTLVGLLIAQSLVNETRGKVLYACNSIQLVEQTRDKAYGYGLEATTYFSKEFSNQLYTQGKAPCITTYQALFNGKSRFKREEISAIIFDDAHTAENVLRDQFTLSITYSGFPTAYTQLLAEFRDYFHGAGQVSTFEEIAEQNSPRLLIVPPFEVKKHFESILAVLREADLTKNTDTLFAWEHLKDHLDLCCYIFSGGALTITPPFIPVRTLPYFQGTTRRIYLSATLNAPDAFARTFGKIPEKFVSPDTPAGACERMILAPILHDDVSDDIATTVAMVATRKALIMTPTYSRSAKWGSIATPPHKDAVTAAVNNFKSASPPAKLLLTARYDGVDLPGDTCRIMVIDGLPSATGSLERFMWEYLRMSKTLRTTIASRVVQSFGRISRGMSDYGVVFLTGDTLVEWLSNPQNQMAMPPFLQKQLQLCSELSKNLRPSEISGTIDRCLDRDESWINAYEGFIDNAQPLDAVRDTSIETELAISEAKFASAMWRRDYEAAAAALSSTLERADELSSSTRAWHQFWIAAATDKAGDSETAIQLYRRAHGSQTNLPAPEKEYEAGDGMAIHEQAKQAALQFVESASGVVECPLRMDAQLEPLRSGGSSNQIEEAIRSLGVILGISSTRPDNEEGTGPDNLWVFGETAFCIDAKTDKEAASVYQKKEIGQMADHEQWVLGNTTATTVVPIFAGPEVAASKSANPPNDLLVITREKLGEIAERVCAACRDVASTSIPLNLASNLSKEFERKGLLFHKILEEFGATKLVDL